jgi:hypothetical protein
VDDTAGLIAPDPVLQQAFFQSLNAKDAEQFEWICHSSPSCVNFLDLKILKHGEELRTATYVKPLHNPQYLHAQSFHNPACLRGIFKGELRRFEANASDAEDYLLHARRLRESLLKRKYPESWLEIPAFNSLNRGAFLEKMRSRDLTVPSIQFVPSLW